jgi:protocatechuate 3,4-dioxygenase beta subunit
MASDVAGMTDKPDTCRRQVVAGLVATGAAGLILPVHPGRAFAQDALAPTPSCEDGDEPTPRQTEGPFYTPRSPERSALREAGMRGTPVVLAGVVVTRSCLPVPGALVDLWHADDAGRYDNDGFRLRGHQFTNTQGRYHFETIVPGLYPGRTRHLHVKFQAPGGRVLTTQFYFPGEPGNERDGLFRPELLLSIEGDVARYVAVLDIA